MTHKKLSPGTFHILPADLEKVLSNDSKSSEIWETLTPLARNEWICWTVSVKKMETREEHVKRVVSELKEGKRRPCCWIGCIHRTDKSMSSLQKFITKRKMKRK